MRVSNQMMANNVKAALFRQTEQMLKTEEQIITGKCINRASDDPIGTQRILEYRKSISSMEQYTTNITNAKTYIDTVDEILNTVTELLNEARGFASDPSPDLRSTFAGEVGTICEQVLQLANSKINGNYLFAGDLTDTQPFDSSGTYAGDSGTKDYMIGDNIQVNLEADGSQVFQGVTDVFAALEDLQTALATDDATGITDQMETISDAIKQITKIRTQNAGRYKRLESAENHYDQFTMNLQQMLSRIEDADIAQAIIDLKVQETTYESTLATSAKIIQPSLIDFLR